jgi:hypothetical protein
MFDATTGVSSSSTACERVGIDLVLKNFRVVDIELKRNGKVLDRAHKVFQAGLGKSAIVVHEGKAC